MRFGRCKLCLRECELQNSHFLPAWLYQLCRDSENNKQPIAIAAGEAKQHSDEIRDYVFCRECEARFNERGESWMHTRVMTPAGFPIQEALKKATPLVVGEQLALYAGGNIPELDMNQIAYFGVSVFWRSAAHNWPAASRLGKRISGIELGPYEELFRLFLLDERPFPENAAILVSVWPYEKLPPVAFHTPVTTKRGLFHCHMFNIPGIDFKLAVGKVLPAEFRQMCAQTSEHRAILSSVLSAERFLDACLATVHGSRPRGKLATEYRERYGSGGPLKIT